MLNTLVVFINKFSYLRLQVAGCVFLALEKFHQAFDCSTDSLSASILTWVDKQHSDVIGEMKIMFVLFTFGAEEGVSGAAFLDTDA